MRRPSITPGDTWEFKAGEDILFSKLFSSASSCIAVLVAAASCSSPVVTVPLSATAPSVAAPEFMNVSGYVMNVKDMNPPGRYDTPRRFLITIKTEDGSLVNLSYRAYPPLPLKDREATGRLRFHAGTVRAGDYIEARGTYSPERNLLEVSGAGDYIETFPEKP